MFIEQGIKKENHFWKYLIGSLIVIVVSQLGAMPLIIGVFIKKMKDGKGMPTEDDFMKTLDSNLTLFLVLLSFVVGLLSLFFVIKKIHNQTILSVTTSRKKLDWSRVFTSFGIWGIFTVLTTYATYYYSPENFVLNFKPVQFAILVVIGVVMIPIQTSCEEYIFRGYLMQGFGIGTLNKKFLIGIFYALFFIPMYIMFKYLIEVVIYVKSPLASVLTIILSISILFLIDLILTKINFFETIFYNKLYQDSKNKFIPLLLTSVIFGGMHIANPEVKEMGYIIMVYYIGTGFMLGILTLMDEGMELSLGFHAANNLVGALLVTSDWSVFQTNSILRDIAKPEAGMETFIPVFVIYPILLFIFSKIYKWTNWKEKLTGNIYENSIETIENIGING